MTDLNQDIETKTEEKTKPKKATPVSMPAAIVTGAAIIGISIVLAFGPKGESPAQQQKTQNNNEVTDSVLPISRETASVRSTDYVLGDRDAQIVVIEYSDSDCPYCKQFHETMKQIVSTYRGKVSWVYRFLPLNIHPNAYTEALALNCAGELGGNDTFWTYADTVMGVTLNADVKSNEALTTFATQSGINGELFKACMKNQNGANRIDTDMAEAQTIGARGTPFSIVVNTRTGKQTIVPGAVPLDYMKQTIDSLMK